MKVMKLQAAHVAGRWPCHQQAVISKHSAAASIHELNDRASKPDPHKICPSQFRLH
jgi:hypothetical protein